MQIPLLIYFLQINWRKCSNQHNRDNLDPIINDKVDLKNIRLKTLWNKAKKKKDPNPCYQFFFLKCTLQQPFLKIEHQNLHYPCQLDLKITFFPFSSVVAPVCMTLTQFVPSKIAFSISCLYIKFDWERKFAGIFKWTPVFQKFLNNKLRENFGTLLDPYQ